MQPKYPSTKEWKNMFAVNFYDATLHSSEKGKSKAMHSNTCELQAYSSKKKKRNGYE